MSSFAFISFSYYKIIYSKFCYLVYLEQVNAAGGSAYSGGRECHSSLATQTSKEDPDQKQ